MTEIKTKIISAGSDTTFIERALTNNFTEFNHLSFTAMPSFVDVHVHFREPGFSYKETISSGSKSASRGG